MDSCKICGLKSWKQAFKGKIRVGKIGGLSSTEQIVYGCKGCEVQRLEDIVGDYDNYYRSEKYREDVGQDCDIKSYQSQHDTEVNYQINILPIETYRDKIVADIGCGGGSFLDAIKGFASKTIAVELNNILLVKLKERGHSCYSSMEELINNGCIRADIVISQSVIEHVYDPYDFIKKMKKIINDRGMLIITTPNANDFLLKSGPLEYKQFFYRKAHKWYFNDKSLSALMRNVGFSNFEINYFHTYNLSNALLWMRERKGLGKNDIINDPACDFSWRNYLVGIGQAERLVCIAHN